LRVDVAVAKQVLDAVTGNAIEAALQAAEQMQQQRQGFRASIALELEQARYEARLADRRYEAVDPDQRLVAAELEARWNASLLRVQELENKLCEFDGEIQSRPLPSREVLLSLAQDLPGLWNSPSTDMRLKQRLIRILIDETSERDGGASGCADVWRPRSGAAVSETRDDRRPDRGGLRCERAPGYQAHAAI
jgi:hypothetical protein